MRVRLTDALDGGVYLESSYRDWNPVKEEFKQAIPWDGRRWDGDLKKWVVSALYLSQLLTFLSQHGAQIQDDRQSIRATDPREEIPDTVRQAFAALYLLPSAPGCVVEASYKALVQYCHPDRGGDVEEFHAISNAIQVLRSALPS